MGQDLLKVVKLKKKNRIKGMRGETNFFIITIMFSQALSKSKSLPRQSEIEPYNTLKLEPCTIREKKKNL